MEGDDFDPMALANRGGISWQIDTHLHALRQATERQDARLYADLVAETVAICRPKLEALEYKALSNFDVADDSDHHRTRRQAGLDYERKLFAKARENLAELLRLISTRGLYALPDESPEEPYDARKMAVKD